MEKNCNISLGDLACSLGSGKHPQLMPSTPRWAVANGAGVILSVSDAFHRSSTHCGKEEH